MKRTRAWTVGGDEQQVERVIADFAQRRELATHRTRRGIEVRGGAERVRGRRAKRAREERLPVRGSIAMKRDRDGALRVEAELRSHGAGALGGRGPLTPAVKSRFDQLLGELLTDLGQSLGAPY